MIPILTNQNVMEKNVYKTLRQVIIHKNNNTNIQPVFIFFGVEISICIIKNSLYTVHKKIIGTEDNPGKCCPSRPCNLQASGLVGDLTP